MQFPSLDPAVDPAWFCWSRRWLVSIGRDVYIFTRYRRGFTGRDLHGEPPLKPTDLDELRANVNAMSARLKLMSHRERLLMLCRMDEGEVSVNELVQLTGLSQSAVSQHLALLRDENLVSIRGEAQLRYYSLSDPIVRGMIRAMCELCSGPASSGLLSVR